MREFLTEHLKPEFYHEFAQIAPKWRVKKRWLKTVPGSLTVLDFEEHPEPDWILNLEDRPGKDVGSNSCRENS